MALPAGRVGVAKECVTPDGKIITGGGGGDSSVFSEVDLLYTIDTSTPPTDIGVLGDYKYIAISFNHDIKYYPVDYWKHISSFGGMSQRSIESNFTYNDDGAEIAVCTINIDGRNHLYVGGNPRGLSFKIYGLK